MACAAASSTTDEPEVGSGTTVPRFQAAELPSSGNSRPGRPPFPSRSRPVSRQFYHRSRPFHGRSAPLPAIPAARPAADASDI
jgi:hypothetical protein